MIEKEQNKVLNVLELESTLNIREHVSNINKPYK